MRESGRGRRAREKERKWRKRKQRGRIFILKRGTRIVKRKVVNEGEEKRRKGKWGE